MRKFENILSQIAKSEGVQPNEVLIEMQQAIQEAYNHRDESSKAEGDSIRAASSVLLLAYILRPRLVSWY